MQSSYFQKTKLPNKPGVYFFKKNSQILYIGKATSLRDRTKSYLAKDLIHARGPLILDMVFRANKLDWQETETVLEALILEASLIKKHQPYYNTREKDNKSFNVVCITKEEFPKVLVLRERSLAINPLEEKGVKLQAKYGPFTNGAQLREAMKIIRPIFPYLDAQSAKSNNFRFYYQIGLAPDIGTKEAKIIYDRNIKNLKLFFEGKKKRVISNFKKEMMLYAKNREFERADEMKRRIFALQHINDIALLKQESTFSQSLGHELRSTTPSKKQILVSASTRIEAYDIAHMGGKNMVGVMTVVEDGEVTKSEYKKFKIRTQSGANDTGALKEVLERRLAHMEWAYPSLIVMDGGVAQINAAAKVLKQLKLKIPVVSVLKDEKHKPKAIMGDEDFATKYKREILLANSEAHRFAIAYHKNMRGRNFLPLLK
ncbi:MAG TPA: GIY-YIG nuclease family protein [Candidatus Paceibacterota bacterium]|jgi:excinuclease ABC subunit C|nr:GIY-YIG nuclease family protein [Candidatus Paceibacterota bacterium]